MSIRLVLHPSAREDMQNIWLRTVEHWGTGQAETYLRGLQAAIDLLLMVPEIARERHDISPPVRPYPYRKHHVIYRVKQNALIVHRIVHAHSDWKEALKN